VSFKMEVVPSLSGLCISFVAKEIRLLQDQVLHLPPHLKSYILPLLCKRGIVSNDNINKVNTLSLCESTLQK
jgi:hypothetical protein